MQAVFAIIGAIFGFSLGSALSHELFSALLGAFAACAILQLSVLQRRIHDLEQALWALRVRVERAQGGGETAPPTPAFAAQPAATAVATTSNTATASPPADANAPSPMEAQRRPEMDAERASRTSDGLNAVARIIRDYFAGGNTLVRVGIVILFFGVAFLLRYVAEHSRVPIQFRLSGVAFGGIVLLGLGWRLRLKRSGYALALQGGGVGVIYLTVFAGMRIYSVLPPGATFALLVVIAALCAILSILQNSQAFALLAVTGGFLAPLLASTGKGDHVVLFSYYAVLNASLLAIAWWRAWRVLNLAGFAFTFVIGTAWGVLKYQPADFASTEPFLILFFLMYVAIAILFAARQPPQWRGYVDGTIVFGTPVVAFGLQSGMLHNRPFALAYSALALSALYLALAFVLHRRRQESRALLVEAFLALGVLFLTLAVPLALDGRWSAAIWALEGAALVWIGCRQQRKLPRLFGSLLQVAGGIVFWWDIDLTRSAIPLLNSTCLGGVMVSAASVFSSLQFERNRNQLASYERHFSALLFCWGVLWWLFSGLHEIRRQISGRFDAAADLVYCAATAGISSELHRRTGLRIASIPALLLLPAMAVCALGAVNSAEHPFAAGGWLSWPAAFAVLYWLCRRHETEPGSPLAAALHTGGLWLATALASWEVSWDIHEAVAHGGSWWTIAWALIPAVVLFIVVRRAGKGRWPIGIHRSTYLGVAGIGIAAYLACWVLVTNLELAGDPYPLPFVPILNPLDLAELFAVRILLRFTLALRKLGSHELQQMPGPMLCVIAGLAFLWLNAALLRTLNHWFGIPYRFDAMARSVLVETALSIFWTVIALLTMLVATRRQLRTVWLTGAALLSVVIVKLFVVDLSHIGTVARIVSFLGVGVLMLVIGYYSPLPPAAGDSAGRRDET